MKKMILAVLLLVFLAGMLTACQPKWEEKMTVTTKEDDPEQTGGDFKQIVSRFAVPEEKTIPEMANFLKANAEYTVEPYTGFLLEMAAYYERVDNALTKYREGYMEECMKHLSEKGCENAMNPQIKMVLSYPKETVEKIEVNDQTSEKAAVHMITSSEGYGGKNMRTETYYLKNTEEGWKVYDVFDFGAKKAISDLAPEERENKHNLQVFRLRSQLEDEGFDAESFEMDECVDELTEDFVFTSETNKAAVGCYSEKYFLPAKETLDTTYCKQVFPLRYRSICYGVTYAHNDMNCTSITNKPAYRSNTYGYLTTEDICNFYYSIESAEEEPQKAMMNCLNIKSKEYAQKCVRTLTPEESAEAA